MRKITFEAELFNDNETVNELDHTARLIEQGYTEGRGWKIEGEKELPNKDTNNDPEESTEDVRE